TRNPRRMAFMVASRRGAVQLIDSMPSIEWLYGPGSALSPHVPRRRSRAQLQPRCGDPAPDPAGGELPDPAAGPATRHEPPRPPQPARQPHPRGTAAPRFLPAVLRRARAAADGAALRLGDGARDAAHRVGQRVRPIRPVPAARAPARPALLAALPH